MKKTLLEKMRENNDVSTKKSSNEQLWSKEMKAAVSKKIKG